MDYFKKAAIIENIWEIDDLCGTKMYLAVGTEKVSSACKVGYQAELF